MKSGVDEAASVVLGLQVVQELQGVRGVQGVQGPDMVAALMSGEVVIVEDMEPVVVGAWELLGLAAAIASQDVIVGTVTAPATMRNLRSQIQVSSMSKVSNAELHNVVMINEDNECLRGIVLYY